RALATWASREGQYGHGGRRAHRVDRFPYLTCNTRKRPPADPRHPGLSKRLGPWGPPERIRRRPLRLDGAGGATGDLFLHNERIDEGDGNGAQQRPRHQLAPVEGVSADQLTHDADRHG